MSKSPTFLGSVQDVSGATVSVALDENTISGLAFIDGVGYRIGQAGSFVRIAIGFCSLFGIVSQVGAGAVPESKADANPYGYRWMRIQLIGEGTHDGKFQRGVSQYPAIGDEAHLVTEIDLQKIYGSSTGKECVDIGTISGAESLPALIDINKMVNRHCAILGSTGSGKSTTTAAILRAITDPDRYPAARVIVMDLHGEYGDAFRDRAAIFRINPDVERGEQPLYVPYWAMSFDELVKVTPFDGISDADRLSLIDRIRHLKQESLDHAARDGVTKSNLTVDSPVPFSIHRFWHDLHCYVCSTHTAQANAQCEATQAIALDESGNPIVGDPLKVEPRQFRPITASGGSDSRVYLSSAPLNIRRQIVAMESRLRDSRFDFLFRPGAWLPVITNENPSAQPAEDLDTLLSSWIGHDKPVTILDLSGTPPNILMEVVGTVLRLVYDALFWSRKAAGGGRDRPALFVLEEAHAYLHPGSNNNASIAAKRIVKEGRKYGLGAMIVSQRPSEIETTILSQCGTLFGMRLSNPSDRSQVSSAASDNLGGLFGMLPSLRTGEAIIVGEAVRLPLRAYIKPPPEKFRPDSHDPEVAMDPPTSGWVAPKRTEDYRAILKCWRSERAE